MSNEREGPPLQAEVLAVVLKCPEEIRPLLWQNVVVAGGSTLMLGLPQRLEKELRLVLEAEGDHHSASAVQVKSFESSILGGSVGNWLGGANVACLPGAFTSSATYYEHGADIFSYL